MKLIVKKCQESVCIVKQFPHHDGSCFAETICVRFVVSWNHFFVKFLVSRNHFFARFVVIRNHLVWSLGVSHKIPGDLSWEEANKMKQPIEA